MNALKRKEISSDIICLGEYDKKAPMSRSFSKIKSNPTWVKKINEFLVKKRHRCLMLEGGACGGAQSLLKTPLNMKNVVCVTNNYEDYNNMIINKKTLQLSCESRFANIASCVSETSKFQFIINDSMSNLYSNVHPEFGHELLWANALSQQIPWMFIWNCFTLRTRQGYSCEIGEKNMRAMFNKLAKNAGYDIVEYEKGTHQSTPSDKSTRTYPLLNTSFYVIKNDKVVSDYLVKNASLIEYMRVLRVSCPNKLWDLDAF
jgi:hypothetical protein